MNNSVGRRSLVLIALTLAIVEVTQSRYCVKNELATRLRALDAGVFSEPDVRVITGILIRAV